MPNKKALSVPTVTSQTTEWQYVIKVPSSLEEESEMIEEILNINLTQTKDASNDKWTADIEVLSQKVPFWIDTGAKCNTLTLSNYQELMHAGELKGSHRVLQSYSNHKLKPVAAVDLRI